MGRAINARTLGAVGDCFGGCSLSQLVRFPRVFRVGLYSVPYISVTTFALSSSVLQQIVLATTVSASAYTTTASSRVHNMPPSNDFILQSQGSGASDAKLDAT